MKIHDLKILPSFFEQVINGNKMFEIRENDRDYKLGDVLLLREVEPTRTDIEYTGRMKAVQVTYITDWQQKLDFVVMGIKII